MPENSELFEQGVQAHTEHILALLDDIIDPTEESQDRNDRASKALAQVYLGPLTLQYSEMETEARNRLAALSTVIKEFETENPDV